MRPDVSREQYVPPEEPEVQATAQALYADSQESPSQTPPREEPVDPESPVGQILGDFQIDFTPNDGVADLNASEQDRNELVDPEMMGELLRTAWKNDDARDVLADISVRDSLTAGTDPIYKAVQLAVESHPELREQLAQAAIYGYAAQSNERVLKVLGDLVKADPTFARAARGFVNAAFEPNAGTFGTHEGVDLLLAMSSQWTRQDFVNALARMSPDQVEQFRAAMKDAPQGIELDPSAVSEWPPALQARLYLVSNEQLNERQQANAMDHAFPGYSQAHLGVQNFQSPIDSRYITASLDGRSMAFPRQSPYQGIRDVSESTMTPEELFKSWGVEADQPLIDQAVQTYGMDVVAAVGRRMAMYNALSPELREETTGSREPLSAAQVAGVIRNGRLGAAGSVGAFLVGEPSLEVQVAQQLEEYSAILSEKQEGMRDSGNSMQSFLSKLESVTRAGYSGVDMLGHAADIAFEQLLEGGGQESNGLFTSGVEEWTDKQNNLTWNMMHQRQMAGTSSQSVNEISGRVTDLQLAMDIYAYEQLRQVGGSELRQDFSAFALLDKYGATTLTQSGQNVIGDLQNGGFNRLRTAGLIRNDEIPQFEGEDQSQKVEEALANLVSLQYGRGGDLDLSLRRDAALTVLDSEPALVTTQQIAASLGQDVATFTTLFQAGIDGTKGPAFVAAVKTTAESIEQVIQGVSAEEIQSMRALKESLSAAAYAAEDPATKLELRARLASVSGILDIVDPQSANHQALMETVRMAQTREFNEDDLGNWFKENGPTIAAAAAAVAITIACAPAGATALSMVLATSASALAATQFTKEALYLVNHYRSDTGLGNLSERSYVGAWVNKNWDQLSQLVTPELGVSPEVAKDLMTSYLMEVAGPMGYEYTQNVVMGLVGLGALRFGQAGFSGLSKQWVSALVRNPQSAQMLSEIGESIGSASTNPAAAAFAKQWLGLIAKETGEEFAEEGVGEIGQRLLNQGGVNPTIASVLIGVAIGAGQGRAEGGFGRLNEDGSVNLHSSVREQSLEQLQEAGQLVEQIEESLYRVSSYENPNESMTLRFTDNAALLDPTADETALVADTDSETPIAESNSEASAASTAVSYLNAASFDSSGSVQEVSQQTIDANTQANAILDELRAKIAQGSVDANTREQYYARARQALLPVVNETARILGIQEITADQIQFKDKLRGASGEYQGATGTITLNISNRDLIATIDHELQHMARDFMRKAAAQADPIGFRNALFNAALAEIGTGGRQAWEEGEGGNRPIISDPEAAEALRALVRHEAEIILNPPEDEDVEASSYVDESMIPENLLAAFDGDAGAVMTEISREARHIFTVIVKATSSTDDLSYSAQNHIDQIAGILRGDGTVPVLENSLVRRMILRAGADAIGLNTIGGDYLYSPDEINSRKLEAAMELKRLKRQLTEAGITTSLANIPQAQYLLNQLQIATYQQQVAMRYASGDIDGAKVYAAKLLGEMSDNYADYSTELNHMVNMGLLSATDVANARKTNDIWSMLRDSLRSSGALDYMPDLDTEDGAGGIDGMNPRSMGARTSMGSMVSMNSIGLVGPVPPPSSGLDQPVFDDFKQSFEAWHDATLRRNQLQASLDFARKQAGSELPRHVRAQMSREAARLDKELEALNQEIPALRENLDTRADDLSEENANEFNREFIRQSIEQQQALAQRMAEAQDRGETSTVMQLNTQLEALARKQGLQLRALLGPLAEIPDTTTGAMNNPQAAPVDRLKEIDRLRFATENPLLGWSGLEKQLADLQARGGVSRWWNSTEIQNIEKQIDAARAEMERLDGLAMQIRQGVITALPPGQTATIGQTGNIPIAGGNFRSQQAQLKRLADGTFELTDGIGGRASNQGMGEYGADLDNYGTYVQRINADGVVTFEQVSATEATTVQPGDAIYVGYNPARGLGTSNTLRIVVPN